MRSRALLLLAAALPAAEPPPLLHWTVDAASVSALLRQEPHALLGDPAAATAAAHAAGQVRILAAGDRHMPPLLALLDASAVRFWGFPAREPVEPFSYGPPEVAMRIDGPGALPWGRWVALQAPAGRAATIAGTAGSEDADGMATATGTDRWLMAKGPAAHALLAAAGPAGPGARLELVAAPVVAAAAAAVRPADAADVDAVMPAGWRTWTPRITVRLDTAAPVFAAEGECSGMPGLPLGTVDPGLAALIPADAEVALAGGVDPVWLARMAPVAVREALPRRRRPAGEALVGALDGRFALWAGWSAGPLPGVVAVVGLRPGAGAAADAAIAALLAEAEPAGVPGADRDWAIALPMGGLTVARAGDRLAVAFDAGAGLSGMPAAAPAPAAVPATAALWIRADLPAIGRRWLPTAWALAQAAREPLGEDPLQALRSGLWNLDEGTVEGTPSALLNGDGDGWRARGIAALFGDDAAVDRRCALWRTADGDPVAVLRTGAAAWLLVGRNDRRPGAMDAIGLERALEGASRLGGPAAADLEIMAIPVQAVFDRRWLPPIEAVVAHLRPWEAVVTARPDGLAWREEGLWGLTALTAAGAHGAWLLGDEVRRQGARRAAEMREQAYRTERPDLMAAFDHIQEVLAGDPAQPLPERASGLTGLGLDPDRLGALWGDGEPGAAADLDRMGRWTPDGAGRAGTIWLIRIDDAWAVAFSRWGSLNLVQAPADLPTRPASGQVPVPMAP